MVKDETGVNAPHDGDEEGDEPGDGGYRLGTPVNSQDGKDIGGHATNTIESHGILDGWWTSTSPEG